MTNLKIGKLLLLETMIVGVISLIIGISVGVFFSKLVAMVLLNVTLVSFTENIAFMIEPKAILITIILFLLIFVLIGLSGLKVIHQFELIDLFKAEKKSEERWDGSNIVLIISFIGIGSGYYIATHQNPDIVVNLAILILLLIIPGTYIFFWGGLPKVVSFIKKYKSRYYQGENLIVITSVSHQMNSLSSLMATIAVLSAVATTAIATGFTLYSNVEINTYNTIGYDLYYYGGQEQITDQIEVVFEGNNTSITEKRTFDLYGSKPEIKPITVGNTDYQFSSEQETFRVYSKSEFNKLISLSSSDTKPVSLESGEVVYLNPYVSVELQKAMIGHSVNFSSKTLTITATRRSNFLFFGTLQTIVVDDEDFIELLQNGEITKSEQKATVLNFENALRSEKLNRELTQILKGNVGGYRTAFNRYNELMETFGLICFIGFFISAIVILMTASLLYFKQVMAAVEEKRQFKMLKKIGMDSQTEKKVITKRLFPIFLVPLFIGILHSVFAMKAADTVVFSTMIASNYSYLKVLAFSAVMYCLYAIVYGLFYFITKAQYSKIVR
ncbi:FtsX-like permease family protein [Anaerobacillus sp. CMMVII]|uniref:FtsX-like permease family protein n=1 Tax=Anaerobacillus sp. CMMVII TaxID=2755588 RepID=UPI0021B8196E|nr:FtsX-like permease family protein [Anaerobacillus sp. CMMVII]